jgi:2-polyprenyl-3-methyl-5-hydroxy-6-metoxy-1,4-benzoquinol methylase
MLAVLLFSISLPLFTQTIADNRALDAFREWEKQQPSYSAWDQYQALYQYAKHLKATGVDESTIQKLIASLNRRLDIDESAFWDRVYSDPTSKYNPLPNQLLVEAVKGVKPGKALDVEMGQGRNAIYLAQQGWDVTGIDFSPIALSLAKEHAKQAGVTIQTVLTKDVNYAFGREQWDLIALIYPMEKRSFTKVHDALKPGGFIVVEGFHHDTPEQSPKFASNELLERFTGFTILRYEDGMGVADWGLQSVRLVKLVAQNPD